MAARDGKAQHRGTGPPMKPKPFAGPAGGPGFLGGGFWGPPGEPKWERPQFSQKPLTHLAQRAVRCGDDIIEFCDVFSAMKSASGNGG